MIIYKDVINGEEIVSDAYNLKEVDDFAYEADGRLITVKAGADVDIGANPSAEEQEEALEEGSTQVIDIVHAFRLQSATFDKKSYMSHIKVYMKKIKEHLTKANPDRVPIFEKQAATFVKKVIGSIGDYDFYVPSGFYNHDTEGMVILVNYREDGITPYFTFFKDGLLEEKVVRHLTTEIVKAITIIQTS
ncbi:10012_t:CDS:2 [Ambispora leptoticha]|uniref:Translationally-controlled tumor protein homolog n=1 Tax=Ambispora leptoticha TaxID=144679 RepID=A0A9N8YQ51_9GLOM|nr:10012_t:CDS:2 [Ambispora leptoticha]